MPSKFSSLFKLPSTQIAAAFTAAQRAGSIEGIRLLCAPSEKSLFIIALTRTIKGGVKRNRLRRRIKAALYTAIQEKGPIPRGIFLCVVYLSAEQKTYQDLLLWLKATLWRPAKTN